MYDWPHLAGWVDLVRRKIGFSSTHSFCTAKSCHHVHKQVLPPHAISHRRRRYMSIPRRLSKQHARTGFQAGRETIATHGLLQVCGRNKEAAVVQQCILVPGFVSHHGHVSTTVYIRSSPTVSQAIDDNPASAAIPPHSHSAPPRACDSFHSKESKSTSPTCPSCHWRTWTQRGRRKKRGTTIQIDNSFMEFNQHSLRIYQEVCFVFWIHSS